MQAENSDTSASQTCPARHGARLSPMEIVPRLLRATRQVTASALVFVWLASCPLGLDAQETADPIPTTTPPITYVINYAGDYFTSPGYIERFKEFPPKLLHLGKATPISHLWGPIRLYAGENQYTGGPGHTLSRQNIALLSPEKLAERFQTIRSTLKRYHALGIDEITPYISYHTLAGDHQKREGFWKFYDEWHRYTKFAGPRPKNDPFDWLVVDRRGKFVGGSCGGYSPDYYAPLHRYRACINHPDWAEWQRRLIRMIAEVGYDGCFIDNAHPDDCFCRYCKAGFAEFLQANRSVAWVRRLAGKGDLAKLALDADDTPPELIRRWRLIRTRDHLGMLRETGREVKPAFTIFPNSGRIDDCLLVGAKCDRLMFESTSPPGVMAAEAPPETDDIVVSAVAGPVEPKWHTYGYELDQNWMEAHINVRLPSQVRVGAPVRLQMEVARIGDSRTDGDHAENFYLLLRRPGGEDGARVSMGPGDPIGGTTSSPEAKLPPRKLAGTWTPNTAGDYEVFLGFRYTDNSHLVDTNRRPHEARLVQGQICRHHVPELLFCQHMQARTIYLGYETRRSGWEHAAELALAEMAAFGGGGGHDARGARLAKYGRFFDAHPELFAGWKPSGQIAVLYAQWGGNPLASRSPNDESLMQEMLCRTHRPWVALVDARLPEKVEALDRFRAICLQSPEYEMSEAQLGVLRQYLAGGGCVLLQAEEITVNGQPARAALTSGPDTSGARKQVANCSGKVVLYNPRSHDASVLPRPIAKAKGLAQNVRFAMYKQQDHVALHAVNYNVCLLDPEKRILPTEEIGLQIPVPTGWKAVEATCYDPDAASESLECRLENGAALVELPSLRLYKILLLERR